MQTITDAEVHLDMVRILTRSQESDASDVLEVSLWQMSKFYLTRYIMILILRVGYKNNSCIRETQENSIKSSLQNSLPYILPTDGLC